MNEGETKWTARVLITGGSGFIGTNLVEHFSAQGAQVLSLDSGAPRNAKHLKYWRQLNLLDGPGLSLTVNEFDPHFVLHMGARTDLNGKTVSDYSANTVGTANLIDALVPLKSLQRVIFTSSRLVCRIGYQPTSDDDYCPSTPYGESKVEGERLVRERGRGIPCPWMIVRPTSIWGPWFDIPYKTFFLTIAKGRYFHPGGGAIYKSFGFVGNTIYQLQHLLDADGGHVHGKTVYLADYPPIEVSEMANEIQRATGAPSIRLIDLKWLKLAARCGDIMKHLGWNNPPLTSFRLANLRTEMIYDVRPLQAIVGPLPFSMQQGINATVKWLQQQGEIP